MLMCRGNGCNWKHVCSRYVLGKAVTPQMDISVEMRDHCPHHQQDFIAVNSEEGRRVAAMIAASVPAASPAAVPEASPLGEERRPQW